MMRVQRKFKDLGINGRSARWYDRNSRIYKLDEIRQFAEQVSKHVKPGDSVLEVAPGPGYLAIELAKLGEFSIEGLDLSNDLVDIATRNANEAHVAGRVRFRQGNVSAMPFADDAFDFIVCSAAFKNFRDPIGALKEMYRVLKNNGSALIVDMNRNAPHEEITSYVRRTSRKGIGRFFMKLTFEWLRDGAYSKDEFERMISATLFKSNEFEIREEGIGFQILLMK